MPLIRSRGIPLSTFSTHRTGANRMKNFFAGWMILAALTLAMQPATAYEGGLQSPQAKGKHPAAQRGHQPEEPRPWESRPWAKPQETRGWETRPWESASEELRPDETRPGEEWKPGSDRRRVGRKARKEHERDRLEKNNDGASERSAGSSRLKQHQDKWRKRQMENELYYPAGMSR